MESVRPIAKHSISGETGDLRWNIEWDGLQDLHVWISLLAEDHLMETNEIHIDYILASYSYKS